MNTPELEVMDEAPIFQNPLIEEARKDAEQREQDEAQSRSLNELIEYLKNGNMPHKVYSKLSPSLQKTYREKFRGRKDHINGRPMTIAEQKYAKAAKRKKLRRARTAKLARKKNRR